MLDARIRDRLAGCSGVLTLLLLGGGWAIWVTVGHPDWTSSTDVTAFFAKHKDAVRIAAILGCFSVSTALWFEVSLYGILRASEGGDGTISRVFFGGALLKNAFIMMDMQFLLTAAWRPGDTIPAVTQGINDLYLAPGVAGFSCWMAMYAAIAVIVLKGRGLPRGLGHAAAVVAAAQLLYLPSGFVHGGIFDVTHGLLGVYVPGGAPLLWTAAAGVVLIKRSTNRPTTSPAMTTSRNDSAAMTASTQNPT